MKPIEISYRTGMAILITGIVFFIGLFVYMNIHGNMDLFNY